MAMGGVDEWVLVVVVEETWCEDDDD